MGSVDNVVEFSVDSEILNRLVGDEKEALLQGVFDAAHRNCLGGEKLRRGFYFVCFFAAGYDQRLFEKVILAVFALDRQQTADDVIVFDKNA